MTEPDASKPTMVDYQPQTIKIRCGSLEIDANNPRAVLVKVDGQPVSGITNVLFGADHQSVFCRLTVVSYNSPPQGLWSVWYELPSGKIERVVWSSERDARMEAARVRQELGAVEVVVIRPDGITESVE